MAGSKQKVILIGGFIALAVAAFVLIQRTIDPAEAGAWLASVREQWWAPVLFIALYALFNTILLPATILTLTAGVVWGWLIGGLWVLTASTIASAVPYWIAWSGPRWVEQLLSRRAPRMLDTLKREGFMTLLLLRLVPIVPYNVLNYAAGFARIRPRDYVSATFIGTIPGIFIFTYLASSIATGLVSPRDAFVRILIAGVLLGGLALVSRLLAKRVRSRLNSSND